MTNFSKKFEIFQKRIPQKLSKIFESCLTFSVTVFGKLLRIKNRSYEERVKVTLVVFVQILCILTCMVLCALSAYNGYKNDDINGYIAAIADVFYVVVLCVNVVSFVCIKSFSLTFFIFSFFSTMYVIGIHFLLGRAFNTIGLQFLYLMIWVASFYNRVYYLFSHITTSMILIGIYIYDIIEMPEIKNLRTSLLYYYAGLFILFNIVFAANFITSVVKEDSDRLLEKVAIAIGTLDFSSPVLKELEKKQDKDCTKVLILFKKIINVLGLYKSYLPASLKIDINASPKNSGITQSIDSSSNDESSDQMDSVESSPRNHPEINEISKGKSYLETRKICYMIVCIKNMQQIQRLLKMDELALFLEKYVDLISSIVEEKNRGVIHSFNRDVVTISFNAVKRVVQHNLEATKCAICLLGTKDILFSLIAHGIENLEFSIVLTSGEVHCGNLGSERLRRYNLFGDCVDRANLMMEYLKKNELGKEVLICNKVEDEVTYHHQCDMIDVLELETGFSEKEDVLVFSLEKKDNPQTVNSSARGVEWIYEIKNDLSKNENDDLRLAWKEYLKGDLFHARDVLDKVTRSGRTGKLVDLLIEKIEKIEI